MASNVEIFFDEIDKVRIINPVVAKLSENLKDESRFFIEKYDKFEDISNELITKLEHLAYDVESEKIKAISAQNILQNILKEKENEQQEIQSVLTERKLKLERLKILLGSLRKTEDGQNETINIFRKL
ncbi:intraflagellar transport protein 20 homolog [Onthophagus taurus]|uniref:intraflagellar transport protein 20 homolog n=1 Tax=Onthophagus taurus TaxID=166361 RepID=UPI0039BDE5E2